MRHIFHEILARYLASDQFAFDASPHELWPQPRPSWYPEVRSHVGRSPAPERGRHRRVYRELERQG
jgi:hypothetical protein